jgi:hypothetical protein
LNRATRLRERLHDAAARFDKALARQASEEAKK